MLLLEDLMHEQFKSLLRANTGVAAAVHYTRSRPRLNVLPLFDSLGDDEVQQLMRHCDSQAQKQVRVEHTNNLTWWCMHLLLNKPPVNNVLRQPWSCYG
jgi:hypothetical protein